MSALLPLRTAADVRARPRRVVSAEALATAAPIVDDVRMNGEAAVRRYAERFGEIEAGAPLVIARADLARELSNLAQPDRDRLERVASRIRTFAARQRGALRDLEVALPGASAGHVVTPVQRAGCYAPGGRYPLPSSVLMTVIAAREAGVGQVWLASPKPSPVTLAAAAVAGADGVLAVGGAHAIAALAFGAGPVPACDMVVGPGNRYVTAAKQLVAGAVGIDMLAGPSELTILADGSANAALVAGDLLAQAEHDPDAVPLLVTTDPTLPGRVEAELRAQLSGLPTAGVARQALANGGVVMVASLDEGIALCDAIAPEHLQLVLEDAAGVARRCANYGAVFIGAGAGEVLGDYGAGPNHVLPTGGSARWTGGLSVMTFLRVRTWLRVSDPVAASPLAEDAAWFARAEGLEAHARAADLRVSPRPAQHGPYRAGVKSHEA